MAEILITSEVVGSSAGDWIANAEENMSLHWAVGCRKHLVNVSW